MPRAKSAITKRPKKKIQPAGEKARHQKVIY